MWGGPPLSRPLNEGRELLRTTTHQQLTRELLDALLVKMGYGGSRKEAGQVVERCGDGGIDGTIKEDRLGLEATYVQAKRWENPVSRPEIIRKLVGALQGQRARKGIFVTTSRYTADAVDWVSRYGVLRMTRHQSS